MLDFLGKALVYILAGMTLFSACALYVSIELEMYKERKKNEA